MKSILENVILSQANRIANGDQDVLQNILSWNYQNYNSALSKGRALSIGERVNFLKHRAGEYRSGIRRDFGHGRYHANHDVFCKQLYYKGEVEIHHIDYTDCEDINDGKGAITAFTSIGDSEANVLFQIDFDRFLLSLSDEEQDVFLMRLSGYNIGEIADHIALKINDVRQLLKSAIEKYTSWFEIHRASA
jgi:hypothetical protein